MADKIKLHDIQGIVRKSGIDEEGCSWLQYELEQDFSTIDDDGEPLEDTCCICGEKITSGWLCGDGGETACNDCVEIVN